MKPTCCSLERCYKTCPIFLAHYASRVEIWSWWGRTSPPEIRQREAILQIDAPPGKHGSKSSKKRKKRTKKQIINLYES